MKPNVEAGLNKELTCTTTSVQLMGSSTTAGATFSWVASNGGNIVSGETTLTPTVNAAGTYTLTVTDPVNGCTDTDTTQVTANTTKPNVEAGAARAITCTTGPTVALSGFSSTPNATFSWSTQDGNIVSGGDTATPTVDKAGSYTLTVTDPANGCTDTDTVEVTLNKTPPQAEAGADKPIDCVTGSVVLAGSSNTPGATFSWSTQDGNIVSGEDTATPTVDKPGTYTLTVTDPANGCTATDSVIVRPCLVDYCSLTQGAYGNTKGKFNGELRLDTVKRLITPAGPLVIGKSGKSLTFPDGTESCLIGWMPAGGTPNKFLFTGDALANAACSIMLSGANIAPTLLRNGKFNNVLLGQTIALSLNLRLDPMLGDLTVCKTMTTQKALPGPDGVLGFNPATGKNDDVPDPGPDGVLGVNPATGINDDPLLTVTIPDSVCAVLGSNLTVNAILNLANCALAGQDTGVATFADINAAVDAINRGFDECRFLIECKN
jgi:hypothetical protein